MDSQNFDVVRALDATPELRADGEGSNFGVLAGHFSEFNRWYEVASAWEGNFMERMAPGAFKDTIKTDTPSMRVLFDHGYDPQIGNKVLGPIRSLVEDKTGPAYEVPLFDTTYNRELKPGLEAGVYGASFRFRALEESWVDEPKPTRDNPKGLPERTITKAAVREFGPVTFGANPGATAGIRSMTDHFYEELAQRDMPAYAEAVRAAGVTPTSLRQGMDDGVEIGDDDEDIVEALLDCAKEQLGEIAVALAVAKNSDLVAWLTEEFTDTLADINELSAIGVTVAGEEDEPADMGRSQDLTGRPATRSGGGGDKAEPLEGEAEPQQSPEYAARLRALQLEGII